LKEKEEQLQVLGVQRASLETSLFELEKEVEEEKKHIEDKWKKEVDSIKSLFENSQMVSGYMVYNINGNGKLCYFIRVPCITLCEFLAERKVPLQVKFCVQRTYVKRSKNVEPFKGLALIRLSVTVLCNLLNI
jgi:hypothetical protein